MRRKKRNKEEHRVDESWLLPYADLLTLLVALFIVLFAMSDMDTQKYKELSEVFQNEFSGGKNIFEHNESLVEFPIESEEDEHGEEEAEEESNNKQELIKLQAIQKMIDDYIDESNLGEVIETELTDEGLLITILNDISFDSGSAVVKNEGQQIAKEVSNFLDTNPPHQIVVSGHADDRPMHNFEFASNWELSITRALNFMGFILENGDLNPTKFSAKGFGEYQPIVPNTSEKNRAKNRRVEVLILPNYEIKTDE
ncbi:chemotaxis protein MotB [Virgibacillus halotolerans]|uniref:flagellar motor protein MotB n=1 Tax=Virgibacillus halotolerans TaxID=1071053 RepID=UPI00195FA541|nr:flagellar motor protein MotB [Virgibacillus halotolerans]MBM7600945.1 chemotaxis protein MotB [Virgibacillus halotolerans]